MEGTSSGPAQPAKTAGAFSSSVLTLCLGILGSAVLPVPYAYSRTGVLSGALAAMAVAICNTVTSRLLIRVAARLNVYSYEALAATVGGRAWGVVARLSLMALLWGTLSGEIALLADLGKAAVADLLRGAAPGWLLAGEGRVVMVALTLCVVLPLCTLRQIRQLEAAATGAMSCLAVMAAVVVRNALKAGFPAIRSGEFPLLELRWTPQTAEAISVFSYAFYVHPMLLPLLQELPRGRAGVDLLSRAVAVATVGVAYSVYGVIGICAAATYGLSTPGDLMALSLLPGWPNGALEGMVAIYLSVSIPALAISLRYTLASLLAGSSESGEVAATTRRQDVGLAALTLAPSMAVALAFPGSGAEKIFSLTGATAGCLLCYCIPVACHLRLYFFGMRRHKRKQGGADVRMPLLESTVGQAIVVPWSDKLIDEWVSSKKRVGVVGSAPSRLLRPHVVPPPVTDEQQQAAEEQPTTPDMAASPFAGVPHTAADIERQQRHAAESGAHFEPVLQRRRSAPLDAVLSNGSMDMRRYASFLDNSGLDRLEAAWLWAGQVGVPAAVLVLGLVLSAMAVAQDLAG